LVSHSFSQTNSLKLSALQMRMLYHEAFAQVVPHFGRDCHHERERIRHRRDRLEKVRCDGWQLDIWRRKRIVDSGYCLTEIRLDSFAPLG
jgi:hypothetical protein